MSFQFIDNNAVSNGAVRRQIRGHVARGKNAGKTVMRPSRKKAYGQRVVATIPSNHISNAFKHAEDTKRDDDKVSEIERQIGNVLSFLPFQERSQKSSCLVQKTVAFIGGPRHATELSNALEIPEFPGAMWVRYMFMDEACFHCAIAISVTAINNLIVKQEDSTDVMRHLSRTFRLINNRLSGNEPVSSTTIAVVLMMVQHERLKHQYHQSLVHIEGLHKMIELHGGIHQFSAREPALALKVLRADLEHSLYLGSATRYSINEISLGKSAIDGLSSTFQRRDGQKLSKIFKSRLLRQLSSDIRALFIDITCMAWLLNEAATGRRPKLDGFLLHNSLIILGYRLLHISPLNGPRPNKHIDNAVHLGLLAFIMTFLRGLDGTLPETTILSELVRSVAQSPFGNALEMQELLLWVLFIGHNSVFAPLDDTWLIPKTTRTMHALGLHTWEDVAQVVARFPWVNALHDKASQRHRLASYYDASAEATPE